MHCCPFWQILLPISLCIFFGQIWEKVDKTSHGMQEKMLIQGDIVVIYTNPNLGTKMICASEIGLYWRSHDNVRFKPIILFAIFCVS